MATTLETSRIRMASLLVDSCSVGVVSVTPDVFGGFTETVVYGDAFGCRVTPLSSRKASAPNGIDPAAQTIFYLPYDAEVEAGNRIKRAGVVYEVLMTTTTSIGMYKAAYVGAGRDD